MTSLDSFDTGIETKNDTRMGGLIRRRIFRQSSDANFLIYLQ